MEDTTSTFDLKGERVKVTYYDGASFTGVLEGVTETQLYFKGQPGGVIRTEIADIAADPLYCSHCKASAAVLHDELCASCYRDQAKRQPPVREPCAVCGAPGLRNPGSDEFLCVTHHAEAGHALRMHGSAAQVLADCLTEDVSSPKHEWGQVRGARFRCIRCQKAEKWDPALLKELQDAKRLS